AETESLGGQCRQRAGAVQGIQAVAACVLADVPVGLLFGCTQLAHIPQRQYPLTVQGSQHIDGSADRGRVGVVGVVDDQCAVVSGQAAAADGDRLQGRQAVGDGLQGNVRSQGGSSRSKGVGHVVPT